MKIKEICEKTGLTDRTVRYYIEEALISPFYTENYLGRKSFDFSEQDVERLKDIATLRVFGFTVEEIKYILGGNGECRQIVEAVKRRTEESLDENKRRLNVLASLDSLEEGDIDALAKKLSTSAAEAKNEKSDTPSVKRFFAFLKICAIFFVVWLPIILPILVLIYKFYTLDTPIIRPIFFIHMLPCFFPSMMTVLFVQNLKGGKKIFRTVFISLCVVCLPFGVLFSSKSVMGCDHNYEAYRTTAEATCLLNGEEIVRCENCAVFKTQTVEKLAHVPVVIHGLAPSCVTSGISDGSECSLCGTVLVEQTLLLPTQIHTPSMDAPVAATCTKSGLTEGSHCSVCNTTLTEQTVIPAKGHAHSAREVAQTCGVDGCIVYSCACGDQYKTDVVRATNLHDFHPKTNENGYVCGKCGLEVITQGTVDATASNEDDAIKFYITGSEYSYNRTLVIYGDGDMPDFETGYEAAWISDYLRFQVCTIIIEEGVTSIGDYAFYTSDYSNVRELIIRSEHIQYDSYNYSFGGINTIFCKITYDY